MMNMLIGRPRTVRPISTTRTRSLAASSVAVYAYSLTSLVNDAALVSSHCVRRLSPGVPGSPNSGRVVPLTGSEYGCGSVPNRSEEHTSELQSRGHLVCRLLLEKKKTNNSTPPNKEKPTDKLVIERKQTQP